MDPALDQDLHKSLGSSTDLRFNNAVLPQTKVDQLVHLCQLDDTANPIHSQLRQALTPTNIQHFINQYVKNFYQHFPLIHLPTFQPSTTHDGLLLAIICTGAVYSDILDIQHTRELARKTLIGIKNTSEWFNESSLILDSLNLDEINGITEELHACVSILSLSIWHGDDLQKLQAFKDWPRCTQIALQLQLNQSASKNHPKFSFFHQPGYVEDRTIADFSYENFLWQEKRIRLMNIIFLNDTVMSFFYNVAPTLDPFQMQVPLPCDDAVWDAQDEQECAKALGLLGSVQQQSINISGSLRKKQPELNLALAVLETHGMELGSRSTNAAGKFLLIHAIVSHLWTVQRYSTLSIPKLPLGDLDWATESKHDFTSANGSQSVKLVETAADKWIKVWDHDMAIQYPPGTERIGFSRDGVHYYWLTKLLIQNCEFINVHSSWDERFHQILKLLKNIKTWVSTNQLTRGETTGAVSLIDERYGLEDLSKDLKLLLAPL